ncbi:NUDIX domain-containing protein [Candidatus Parcubacteria bacterium]|nr:MAG: NUDIX domain-containing protein [Candidatus Parcubacteria bacterium]
MSDKITFGEKVEGIDYRYRPGVYFVIFDKGKVALVKTSTGYFLPGGGIEIGESHQTCMEREALEELGWRVEIGDYLGNAENYFLAVGSGRYIIMDGYFYLAKKLEQVSQPTEPDHATVWLEIAEARDKMWHPAQAWAIEEAYKKISQS